MRSVVDTCGWIEWLSGGVLASEFEPWLEKTDEIYVPTCVQFELYKWVKREQSEVAALEVVALTEQGRVTPLDTAISLLAADLSMEFKLSFADSIIYASAQQKDVKLITSDDHFLGLNDVVYFKKGQWASIFFKLKAMSSILQFSGEKLKDGTLAPVFHPH